MSDNLANPLKEAETDVQKAQKAISGLLNPKEEEKTEEHDYRMQNRIL